MRRSELAVLPEYKDLIEADQATLGVSTVPPGYLPSQSLDHHGQLFIEGSLNVIHLLDVVSGPSSYRPRLPLTLMYDSAPNHDTAWLTIS